jgi:RimJ/RimL family protein N-acetyltransferase
MSNCRRLDTAITGNDFSEFSYRLLNEKNYLPDILKGMTRMMEEYAHTMSRCCQPFALVGPGNKMGGVFFINGVIPGHEADFYMWMWNPKCYTATTNKFLMGYIEHYAEEYQLARVVCRTPDDKGLGRLLEALGFKLEGRFRNAYKSGGVLTTLYQYRRLFRFGGCV